MCLLILLLVLAQNAFVWHRISSAAICVSKHFSSVATATKTSGSHCSFLLLYSYIHSELYRKDFYKYSEFANDFLVKLDMRDLEGGYSESGDELRALLSRNKTPKHRRDLCQGLDELLALPAFRCCLKTLLQGKKNFYKDRIYTPVGPQLPPSSNACSEREEIIPEM